MTRNGVFGFEQKASADHRADAAEADDDDVAGFRRRGNLLFGFRGRSRVRRRAARRHQVRLDRSAVATAAKACGAAGRSVTRASDASQIEHEEEQRVEQDRQDRAGQDEVAPSGGSRPRLTPSTARMKENSPICARLAEIVSAVPSADGGRPARSGRPPPTCRRR
jgi:hypothetical protein